MTDDRYETHYAVVREDKPPRKWWDGYHTNTAAVDVLIKYWSRTLGVRCYAIVLDAPTLPGGNNNGMVADAWRHGFESTLVDAWNVSGCSDNPI
jgi:hypothetical protein